MTAELPKYDELFQPVLDVLKDLGGSGQPAEVRDLLVERLSIPDSQLELTVSNGTQLFLSRVQWARLYLAKTGYLDSSKRGVWSLTQKGKNSTIEEEERKHIVAHVRRDYYQNKKAKEDEGLDEDGDDTENEVTTDYRQELLAALQAMPPDAFERLSQRLLRESGFERVIVTGKTGDGGIDGHGVLQVNAFVSFRTLFQCKRYKGSVGAGAIRDFRGAMQGRAEKGIILTTGTFTPSAEKEATRDGVPPIELVDGDALVTHFGRIEFGLRRIETFEVDHEFLNSFYE